MLAPQGLEGPVTSGLLKIQCFGLFRNLSAGPRVRRPESDPFVEQVDLILRKLFLRRHLKVRILIPHRFNERALFRFAGHDRREPRRTTGLPPRP